MEFTNCKLIDILADMHSGGTPSTTEPTYWNGDIKWLSSGETGQRFINDTIDKITTEGVKKSSTKLAKKHNVVMACAGQGKTRGQTSYLLDDMYINQSVIALEPKSCVLPLYLFYDLTSRYEELRGGSDASSTRGSITTTSLKKLNFRYPSLDKQKKITNILYSYDELIENNNKRIKILEQMAENLYKEWFVRFRFPGHETTECENGLPKGWKTKKFIEEFNIIYGKGLPTEDLTFEGYPVFGSNGLIGYYTRYMYEKPQVLISCRGASSGVVNISLPCSFITSNSLICEIDERTETSFEYLSFALKNYKLTQYQTGSAQPQITIDNIRKLKIIIPTNKVIEEFKGFISSINEKVLLIKVQNQNLIKQRDMLLPRLMSGKLEVN